jgi:hypothetical protein
MYLSTRDDLSDGLAGTLNASYRGSAERSQFKPKAHDFNAFGDPRAMVVSTEMRTGGKTMRNGSLGGFLTLQYAGDGYDSSEWVCYRDAHFPRQAATQDNSAWQAAHPQNPLPTPTNPTNPTPGGPVVPKTPKPTPAGTVDPATRTVVVEGAAMSPDEAASVVHLCNVGLFGDFNTGSGLTITQSNAIPTYRTFSTVEDVAAVPGIGQASLIKLRDYALPHGF